MKKNFFIKLYAFLSILHSFCIFTGCSIKETEDEILEPRDDYELDLARITINKDEKTNEPAGSYDKENHILEISAQWKSAQIWLSDFDASQFRYLKIEYEPIDFQKNLPFRLHARYMGVNDSDYIKCEQKRRTQYVKLDRAKRNHIQAVFLQSETKEPVALKINRLCFTQNKILSPAVIDSNGPAKISNISACKLVSAMGIGWNLSNTLEAHSFSWQENPRLQGMEAEFHWQKTETTRELLRFAFENGYRSIRIPVTWYCHLIDENYTIDPDWMMRVKEIVDMALDIGYYVILNEHHSVHGKHTTEFTIKSDGSKEFSSRAMNKPLKRGDGYLVTTDINSIIESKRFLNAVWTQIAQAFNTSYDEHLIFETMNEPRNPRDEHKADSKGVTNHEWIPGLTKPWYKAYGEIGGYWCDATKCSECLYEYKVLNAYNQICLDAIRKTGGANAERFVIIPSLCTGTDTLNEHFSLPKDSAVGKLILSGHSYPFGSSLEGTKENQEYSEKKKTDMQEKLSDLNERFVKKGYPIIWGETGAVRSIVPLEERIKWITAFAAEAKKYGMSILYWESGDDKDGAMAEIDRKNLCFYEPAFVEAMLNAWK